MPPSEVEELEEEEKSTAEDNTKLEEEEVPSTYPRIRSRGGVLTHGLLGRSSPVKSTGVLLPQNARQRYQERAKVPTRNQEESR